MDIKIIPVKKPLWQAIKKYEILKGTKQGEQLIVIDYRYYINGVEVKPPFNNKAI